MPRRSRAELATPHLVDIDYQPEPPPPPPPSHLSAVTQAWWVEVTSEFVLKSHHCRVLECACDAWDRMVQARTILAAEGLSISTADDGLKLHPAFVAERDSRLAFLRVVRELDLDSEPKPSDRRPPPIYSNRR
jgi:P27 family predicted phage terminase small subunit